MKRLPRSYYYKHGWLITDDVTKFYATRLGKGLLSANSEKEIIELINIEQEKRTNEKTEYYSY